MLNMAHLGMLAQTPEGRRMLAQQIAANGGTAQGVAQAAQSGLGQTIAGPPALSGTAAAQGGVPTPPIPQPRPANPAAGGLDPKIEALMRAAGGVQAPQPPQNPPILQPTLPRRGDVNISQAGVSELAALMNLQQQQQVPSLGALIGGV